MLHIPEGISPLNSLFETEKNIVPLGGIGRSPGKLLLERDKNSEELVENSPIDPVS